MLITVRRSLNVPDAMGFHHQSMGWEMDMVYLGIKALYHLSIEGNFESFSATFVPYALLKQLGPCGRLINAIDLLSYR